MAINNIATGVRDQWAALTTELIRTGAAPAGLQASRAAAVVVMRAIQALEHVDSRALAKWAKRREHVDSAPIVS
jgi:hypothetical protein